VRRNLPGRLKCVQTVLPFRSDGCCFLIRVWTWNPISTRTLNGVRKVLPRRPDGCTLEQFKVSRHWWASGWKVLVVRTDNAHSSGWLLGIRLLWVEICTESSLNIEIAFMKFVTLATCHRRLFPHQRNKLWISEDSEIYGIPVKAATLHNSDFFNRMMPIKN